MTDHDSSASSLQSTNSNELLLEYKQDPVLGPLMELGMTPRDLARHKNLPRASILVLLFPWNTDSGKSKSEWHVLLTQRPLHLKSHPGEVCFPGGRQEDADQGNDLTTAIRETTEEVGIVGRDIIPLARMETVESVNGLCVTPIIAVWTTPQCSSQLDLCKTEVEAAFYVPVSYFWNDDHCDDQQELEWRGGTFIMRTYYWKDDTLLMSVDGDADGDDVDAPEKNHKKDKQQRIFKIWGLTAHVAYEMAQICKPPPTNTNSIPKNKNDGASSNTTTTTTIKQQSTTTNKNTTIKAGSLYRWVDDTRGKPYWAQRYFVLVRNTSTATTTTTTTTTTTILHQYDSERKASSKADTATKKNRLLLDHDSCHVKAVAEQDHDSHNNNNNNNNKNNIKMNKYAFTISVLSGRIQWRLAALSQEEREDWMSALLPQSNTNSSSIAGCTTDTTGTSSSSSPSSSNTNNKLKL